MKPEFEAFLESKEETPPAALSAKVGAAVRKDLSVRAPWLAAKLVFLHALVGAATLAFCPQFNVGPSDAGISSVLYALMKVHHVVCAVFCGTVFLGSAALVSSLALRPAEVLAVKRKSWGVYSVLAAVSLGVFMVTGSAFQGHYDAVFSVAWLTGGVVSAWALMNAVARLRLGESPILKPGPPR